MTHLTKKLLMASSALCLAGSMAQADQVFLDDVIVDGSLCVGQDCVNGESFGFDTIRLKENNLRIKFDDTSTSASFPRNDWQLTANDSSNGGNSYFSIQDITGSRTPFTVTAGAPNHSLFVDSGGDVGMGTNNPVLEAHIVDGDSPTLRLEQNGSSGFTPQTWDLAGNETNFFLRDVTNGSQLPLRVFPGADTNSLTIAANNNVGIGIQSAQTLLHVVETTSGATELLRMTANGVAYSGYEDTTVTNDGVSGRIWNIQNAAGEFRITTPPGGAAEKELTLDVDGNLTINGEITTAGSCSAGCDRVFDPDYQLPTIAEQREMMFAQRHLPNVGPTPEEGPMNLSAKVGGMLNELEKAHIYIGQLEERLAALEAQRSE